MATERDGESLRRVQAEITAGVADALVRLPVQFWLVLYLPDGTMVVSDGFSVGDDGEALTPRENRIEILGRAMIATALHPEGVRYVGADQLRQEVDAPAKASGKLGDA